MKEGKGIHITEEGVVNKVGGMMLGSNMKLKTDWNPPFEFDWDNASLWALNLPVYAVPIQRLAWIVQRPIWSTVRGMDLRNLHPIEVLKFPSNYPEHYGRILSADIKYPIECMWIKGKYYVLDGVHRLAKHLMLQCTSVNIRKVKNEHIQIIRKNK